MCITVGELEGERREDHLEIAAVLEIPRTEEAGSQFSVCKARLGKCLGDRRLPGPREAVQPEDALTFLAVQPAFDLPQDLLPSSLQASLPFPTEVTRVRSVAHPLEPINIY